MKCNTCESAGTDLLWTVEGVQIYRCRTCGLVCADCTGIDLTDVYEEDYYKKVYPDYETDRESHAGNHRDMLEKIERMAAKGTILEIGSAFGYFLASAQRRGWAATGYELSEYAGALAREKYGTNVIQGDFIEAGTTELYDCACLFDTIEHLPDPNALIRKVASSLKPGGCFVLTTGDIASPVARIMGRRWRMVQLPFHLYYYSPRSITALLEKHGFSVDSITHDGKYQNLGSIAQYLFRIPKETFPAVLVKINLGDIMTVTAHLKPAGRTGAHGNEGHS